MKMHLFTIVVLIVSVFGAFQSLLPSGFFTMHDDTQVARVVVMGRALRTGQFPVRWVSKLGYGYGYPIFNFYGPLPYYVGGFIYALGVNGLLATKIIFFIAILGAALSMYWLGTTLYGKAGGYLSALLYTYAPYHAVQLYIRGSLSEAWVMIFLPLIALGVLNASIYKKIKAGILLCGLGLAGTILSHTILGYVTTVLFSAGCVFVYFIELFGHVRNKIALGLIVSVGIGLGLSAFFWLPAITEMNATNVTSQIGPTSNYKDHFVCISQLWDSSWGFGGSIPGCVDGLSYRIGKIHILVSVITLAGMLLKRKNYGHRINVIAVMILVSLLSTFFLLNISQGLWELLPKFEFIQYPWRFLTFIVFGLSLVAGGSVLIIKNNVVQIGYLCIIVILSLFVYPKLFSPQFYYQKSPFAFETDSELKWRVSRISDEYLPKQIIRPKDINEVPKNIAESDINVSLDTVIDTETYTKIIAISNKSSNITLQRAYFSGWKYILDGKEFVPVLQSGLPVIHFTDGLHTLEFRFVNIPVRTLANVISIITVFLLLYLYDKKNIA